MNVFQLARTEVSWPREETGIWRYLFVGVKEKEATGSVHHNSQVLDILPLTCWCSKKNLIACWAQQVTRATSTNPGRVS